MNSDQSILVEIHQKVEPHDNIELQQMQSTWRKMKTTFEQNACEQS